MKTYYVYIMTNQRRGTLYIGVTGNIEQRVLQHRKGKIKGFTKKYALNQFVYAETFDYIYDAIKREKQLKNWQRDWKIDLIEKVNPAWEDLLLATSG